MQKSYMREQMLCPLTGGTIDSDLCYDVQECIAGIIPVSLELEDFLEPGDCEKICLECEYHILSDQANDYCSGVAEDDCNEGNGMGEEKKQELANIVKKLEEYRISLEDLMESEQEAYDRLSDDARISEEGRKRDRLISALCLGTNYLKDIISVFGEHVAGVDIKEEMDAESDDCGVESSVPVLGPAGINSDSYIQWAEELKKNIQVMENTFHFCGLKKPGISCYVEDTEESGTNLDIYVEVSGDNGESVSDCFVLKLNLYTEDDTLVGAKEIEVQAGSFSGFDTYLFRFSNCKRLDILSYGKLYVSKY